jgi:hypothetical protein
MIPVLIPSFVQRLLSASLTLAEGDFIEKAVIWLTNHCFFMAKDFMTKKGKSLCWKGEKA